MSVFRKKCLRYEKCKNVIEGLFKPDLCPACKRLLENRKKRIERQERKDKKK